MFSSCPDLHDHPDAFSGGVGVESSDEKDEYVGPHDVARALRISQRTVIRWADNGWLSDSIVLGGHRRFRRKDVEALAEQMKRHSDGRD